MSDPEVHRKLVEEHAIDETPISPVRSRDPSRRNSLEHHLQTRPSREELIGSASSPLSSSLAFSSFVFLLETKIGPELVSYQFELRVFWS